MQCFHCEGETPDPSIFCARCGGRLVAPPVCPSCGTEVPDGARFCAGCGASLLKPRPAVPTPPEPVATPPPAPAAEDAQAILQREAARLPAVSSTPRSSSVGANVLVFVAVLALLVLGIYVANKGKPKEATMFGGGGPAPAAGPPAAPAPEGESPPAAGPSVSGLVRLASPDLVLPEAVLFIAARSSAMGGKGPPLAVRRVNQPTFPYAFELGPADRMIAQMPWAGPLDITARLDTDGNAMTRGADDLTAGPGLTNVDLGRTDLELVLQPGE